MLKIYERKKGKGDKGKKENAKRRNKKTCTEEHNSFAQVAAKKRGELYGNHGKE